MSRPTRPFEEIASDSDAAGDSRLGRHLPSVAVSLAELSPVPSTLAAFDLFPARRCAGFSVDDVPPLLRTVG